MNMHQLLVAIVVSTFSLSSTASFAAGTLKLEELTKEQRMDMRSRADQLTADRTANGGKTQAVVEQAPKVKKPRAAKPKTDIRS
jgi:outer membrane murein-binding lipoprotein Lpp